MSPDWKSAYAAMHERGEADFPPAALQYLLDLVREGSRERGGRGLGSAEIVAEFRRRSRRDFGAMTGDVLRDWGLRTPADLGRALTLLARYGCLALDAGDTPEAFASDPEPFDHA